MDELTCPKCQSTMSERVSGGVTVHQCPDCEGIFLERAELGNLVDAEIDWHRGTGPATQPIPRISEDMVAPPPLAPPSARSYIETLFR
jgi:Zn-finger nucleic acid-binding protein